VPLPAAAQIGVTSAVVASGCLDEATVVAFLEGTLAPPRRSAVEHHLAKCGSCTELMTWAAADQAHRSRTPGQEGRPLIGQLSPGSRVDRYQILHAVGRGGMGEVYAAYHPDLDRCIALKVVSESGADALQRRTRLLREARTIARLSHPNVVGVYDAGTVGERVYIAMEFVEGQTVDAWLRTRPRGWREILDVFIAAGRGLAAAHAAGIVHRDFKPQNVMIARAGSVRVMDFGLARLAEEPSDASARRNGADAGPSPATVTKTGGLVGTPAYMAPEQFRGETIDARADQFSFCVALHEALYGSRPSLAHLPERESVAAKNPAPASTPAWLRAIVSRGLADERAQRFPSMDALLRALERGRARPKRRVIGAATGVAIALLVLGGWRAARGGRITCEAPRARLQAVWSGQTDARRQSIHDAFSASGRPTAETSWQRVSRALDDYVGRWSAMYVDVCEATHVRGEQSGEVLDLRMACLNEQLDQLRAVTNILSVGDALTVANATMAVQNLAPLNQCDDLATLRPAVPPPRDPRIARTVRELRATIKDVKALDEVGNFRGALEKARSIRAQVEATQYRPLLGELLSATGAIEAEIEPASAEAVLEEAVVAATASRDDVTAAVAASTLAHAIGSRLARPKDGHRWTRLAHASLDRTGVAHQRIRSWILHNEGVVYSSEGQFESAQQLVEQGMALKEELLGSDHPDVARSLTTLCAISVEWGRPQEALRRCNRSIEILRGIDPDSALLASGTNNRGEVLNALGRPAEAVADFRTSLRVLRIHYDSKHLSIAHPLQGLGEATMSLGNPAAAVPFLEEALNIRDGREPQLVLVADTRFALARAYWGAGANRRRARALAIAARSAYIDQHRPEKARDVTDWLATHRVLRRLGS
jgi:eukaryotic-like serine/threonine-protein kinase